MAASKHVSTFHFNTSETSVNGNAGKVAVILYSVEVKKEHSSRKILDALQHANSWTKKAGKGRFVASSCARIYNESVDIETYPAQADPKEKTMSNVEGLGRVCDTDCPICTASRDKAQWLRPPVKFMYYCFCGKPAMFLRIPTPCTSREKQTGKKPWE